MAENPDIITTDKNGQKDSDTKQEVNGVVPGEGTGSADIPVEDDGQEVVSSVSVLDFVAGVNVSNPTGDEVQVDVLVDTNQISDGAVATAKLAAAGVTNNKLAADAVDTTELIDAAVTNAKVALDAVDTPELADNAVDTTRLAASAVTAAKVAADAIGTSQLDLSIAPTWTGEHDFSGGITGLPTPDSASDAATKEYTDALKSGFDYKDPVEAATDGTNIDLTSTTDPNPIDGYTLADGDRVLLKDQTAGSENGIYVASTATDPSTWVRASDADEDSEVTEGMFAFVENGDINGSRSFILITESPTLGTDALEFAIFSDAGSFTAGNHLSKNGSEFNVEPQTIPVGDLNNVSIQAMLEGLDADKPAAGTAGRFYWATDTQLLYRDDGASWNAVSGAGTSSNPLPEQYVQSLNTEDANITSVTLGQTQSLIDGFVGDDDGGAVSTQPTGSVSTTPTAIHDPATANFGVSIIAVAGTNGSAFFAEIVQFPVGFGSPSVVSTPETLNSPANRTYTRSPSNELELAMDSGTYEIKTSALTAQGAI